MKKTAAFYTLGCKVNQYETNAMEKLFSDAGYEIAAHDSPADVYIVNTCTVTSTGDKKCRQLLRRLKGQNDKAVIAAVGCLAQTAPEKLEALGIVDVIIGTNQKREIVNAVEAALQGKKARLVEDIMHEKEFEDMPIDAIHGRERAYIKIQEGCDRFCSYCIIPYARGAVRSRSEESVLAQAKHLAENGFSEIVLTGIHVASYGRDIGSSLRELLVRVNETEGIERIRLSSIDPAAFTPEFISSIAALPKICPHFHISLQSGSATVLKRMNRRYTPSEYMAVLTALRQSIEDVSVTTDVITGFPGESETEFEQTLEFVRNAGFSAVHVFPYSEREGTPAAGFDGAVAKSVRAKRAEAVSLEAAKSGKLFAQTYIGRIMPVLIEGKNENGFHVGFTPNYLKIHFKADDELTGKIVSVLISEFTSEGLLGELQSYTFTG